MAIGHEQLPATEEQRKMVAQLLREFPLSRGLFEYEDYQTAPTRGNASEFITRALEDNYDQIAKRDNYVSYIASRPRAQRAGAHALFTGSDAPLVLSQIAAEVAHHPGNVWLPIISLRREDAARLGYDDAGQWKNLIAGYAMEMAEAIHGPVPSSVDSAVPYSNEKSVGNPPIGPAGSTISRLTNVRSRRSRNLNLNVPSSACITSCGITECQSSPNCSQTSRQPKTGNCSGAWTSWN